MTCQDGLNLTKFAASMEGDHPGFTPVWDFALARIGKLESPLEVEFLANWVLATFQGNASSYAGALPSKPSIGRFFDLRAQQWIGNFRVDFALDVFPEEGSAAAGAIIEIDGFTYHGDRRSFEADRARDQSFLAAGKVCFRFTQRSLRRPDPLGHLFAWARSINPLVPEIGAASQSSPVAPTEFDIFSITKQVIEAAIWGARDDPAEMKRRVTSAYEDGHLSADEAEEWIVLQGLEAA